MLSRGEWPDAGRNRRSGFWPCVPTLQRVGAAAGTTPCEIKTLSRVASVSDNPLRMTHSAPNPGGENRTGARVVRVPDDRAGQRLDNFLLGQLKGVPRSEEHTSELQSLMRNSYA